MIYGVTWWLTKRRLVRCKRKILGSIPVFVAGHHVSCLPNLPKKLQKKYLSLANMINCQREGGTHKEPFKRGHNPFASLYGDLGVIRGLCKQVMGPRILHDFVASWNALQQQGGGQKMNEKNSHWSYGTSWMGFQKIQCTSSYTNEFKGGEEEEELREGRKEGRKDR